MIQKGTVRAGIVWSYHHNILHSSSVTDLSLRANVEKTSSHKYHFLSQRETNKQKTWCWEIKWKWCMKQSKEGKSLLAGFTSKYSRCLRASKVCLCHASNIMRPIATWNTCCTFWKDTGQEIECMVEIHSNQMKKCILKTVQCDYFEQSVSDDYRVIWCSSLHAQNFYSIVHFIYPR